MHDSHSLTLRAPATSFYEALLLGNGRLGAAVHGIPGRERIDVNLDTFWSGGPVATPRDGATPAVRWLPALRRAVRDQDWAGADELAQHLQATGWTQAYQPLGGLVFSYAERDDDGAGLSTTVSEYSRTLDMAAAVARSSYWGDHGPMQVISFVSAVHGVLVVEVRGHLGTVEVDLDCPHPVTRAYYEHHGDTSARRATPSSPTALTDAASVIDDLGAKASATGARRTRGDRQRAMVTTWAGRAPTNVLPDYFGEASASDAVVYDENGADQDGLVDAGMGFAVAVATQRTAQGARLIVAASDGFRGRAARPSADLDQLSTQAVEQVLAVANLPTDQLRFEHTAEHRRWFDAMDLELIDVASLDDVVESTSGTPPSGKSNGQGVAWRSRGDTSVRGEDPTARADDAIAASRSASTSMQHASARDAARFFHLGRYLLIASSRPGTQPANLQGIWNTDVRPGWSCNFTTNINLQMNYWLAGPAGLIRLADPLHRLVEDLAELGQSTAQDYYDSAGWVVHHNSDIWGFTAPVRGRWPVNAACANWPAGTWWLALQYASASHFATFQGRGAAANPQRRAVVLGACELALSLLEEHHDGLLVTNPSTSPEHLFIVEGQERSLSAGTAIDQQLVAELLQVAIALVDDLGEAASQQETNLASRARTVQQRLRPPQVGTDGDLLEWADQRQVQDRGHRHLSHLYGLFPGTSIDEVTTPELFAAARAALADRVAHGAGGTGWSQAWVLCLGARLRDPDLVQHSLDVLVHSLTSQALLDLHPVPNHPSGYRFQIDGNLGAAAGILEAVVHSTPGQVRLLPAMPRRWESGVLRGLHTASAHVVDLRWSSHSLDQAVLIAVSGSSTTVWVPDDPDLIITCQALTGGNRRLQASTSARLPGYRSLTWSSEPGERLLVRRQLSAPNRQPEASSAPARGSCQTAGDWYP